MAPATGLRNECMNAGGACEERRAVLVVNPNHVGWRYLAKTLRATGYQVDHAMTGKHAARLLEKHAYQAIVIEPELPDMDGLDVCTLARAYSAKQKPLLIVITASTSVGLRLRAWLVGVDAYLTIPMRRPVLHAMLGRFLPACSSIGID